VPFVSLNHQHFLVACDLSSLPLRLQGYGQLMSWAVRAHHPGQNATIVSSFFKAPLRRGYDDVQQVGPLLRPEIRAVEKTRAARTRGEYLLSYLRSNTPQHVLELLKSAGREVRVYGLGQRKPEGPLTFCKLSEQTFVDDLAGCAAVVGAAGNQTLGEALYLGKPVLAMPEERHHEQLINAHFLRQMKAGDWTTMESAEPRHLARFLDRLDEYQEGIESHSGRLDGTPAALGALARFLPPRRDRLSACRHLASWQLALRV